MPYKECRWVSSPFLRQWARRWINHSSATPDLRLPSQPQSITVPWSHDRYQITLLGDRQRHICVWTTCPRLLPESGMAAGRRSNPRPFELQVQRSNHYATRPHMWFVAGAKFTIETNVDVSSITDRLMQTSCGDELCSVQRARVCSVCYSVLIRRRRRRQ